jgi:peptidoglycan/LPS O-acetylase OafA/YrhL
MFAVGMLLFEFRGTHPRNAFIRQMRDGLVLLSVAVLASLFVHISAGLSGDEPRYIVASRILGKVGLLAAACWMLCRQCFERRGNLHTWLDWPPIRWLGNMSYSYYLIHSLAIHAVAAAAKRLHLDSTGTLAFPACLMAAFALSVVLSTALFHLVEAPYSLRTVPKKP